MVAKRRGIQRDVSAASWNPQQRQQQERKGKTQEQGVGEETNREDRNA
jgi:hypothetical protein